MAPLPSRALRHVFAPRSTRLRQPQRRWAQVHDVRFVATGQVESHILEKYRDKLERKAKEVGVKDIDELQKLAAEKKIQPQGASSPSTSLLPHHPPPPPPPPLSSSSLAATATSTPAPNSTSASSPATASSAHHIRRPPGVKSISSFLDLHKILALPAAEIETIWRLRHASHPRSLCASIPTPTYRIIEATARAHPQFLLPLPRAGQGAEMHFLQWTFPAPHTATVLFTRLAEYKLHGEFARPHTTVTCHAELADDKGVVLLQGGVVEEERGVTVEEARWLVMWLQRFYGEVGEDGGKRKRLLEGFTRGEKDWNVEDVLEEVEKIL